jgi:CRISPR-associated protein (TIGR02584 family)
MTGQPNNLVNLSQSRVFGPILEFSEPMQPSSYSRRVLLAAAGMTPQVLTETLYALGRQQDPFFPTEVRVVTTAAGRERILLELLGEENAWFRRLYQDYPFPPPAFGPAHIQVIAHGDSPLADIRDEADNALAADTIASQVRELTADPACALHVSMAGGRKTMGYFAGAALSLYGRDQDRLSHVLVSEAFEGNAQFFYPAPRQRVIYTRDNKPLNAAEATITLADIPFVRLRHWLPPEFLEQPRPFREAIAQARLALEPQTLHVDLATRMVRLGDRQARAPQAELAFLLWILQRQREGNPAPCPSDGGGEKEPAGQFLQIYRQVHGDVGASARTPGALRGGMERNYFLERCSRWNGWLKKQFGQAASDFRIEGKGRRGATLYQVAAAPRIEIKQPKEELA